MKRIPVLVLLFLLLLPFSEDTKAQKPDPLYRVVFVKGKPMRSGKQELRDGQKIEGHEKIMFTTASDVVILMNDRFDKICLRPGSTVPIRTLVRVVDFPQPDSEKMAVHMTRGTSSTSEIQSVGDTIQLNLLSDLKKPIKTPLASFSLYNYKMDTNPGYLSINGEYLFIHTQTPGNYFLYYASSPGKSEILAEIEFLDPAEVKAELYFIARETEVRDSVPAVQKRFLQKQYPKLSADKYEFILAKSR